MDLRWLIVAFGYALLGVAGALLAVLANDANPLWHPAPLLHLAAWARATCSIGLGALFAALVVVLTRVLVARATWARRLHEALRPVSRHMSNPMIGVVAVMSAMGEEFFFRGFLTPWIGVIGQALIFGAMHQLPGSSRWWWMAWAALAGLVLGALYWTTGSLLGPILAHALINAVNLAYLRDYDPVDRPTRLGGLLRT